MLNCSGPPRWPFPSPLWFPPPDPTTFSGKISNITVYRIPKMHLGNFSFRYTTGNGQPASTTSITLALTNPAHLPGDVIACVLVLAGTSRKQTETRRQQCWETRSWRPVLPRILLCGAQITKTSMLLLSLSNAKGSFTASYATEI